MRRKYDVRIDGYSIRNDAIIKVPERTYYYLHIFLDHWNGHHQIITLAGNKCQTMKGTEYTLTSIVNHLP